MGLLQDAISLLRSMMCALRGGSGILGRTIFEMTVLART